MERKFTKVTAGWYATEDGQWAVVVDGYAPGKMGYTVGGEVHDMGVGNEWALVHDPEGNLRKNHNDGENVDWFDTKREAVEAAQRA